MYLKQHGGESAADAFGKDTRPITQSEYLKQHGGMAPIDTFGKDPVPVKHDLEEEWPSPQMGGGEQEPDAFARALPAGNLTGLSGNIPAYTLLNASVNFKPVGSNMTYFLSAHNLADRQFLVSRRDGMFAGRERQVFGGVRFDF
jgi:hypothetical protein